MLADELGFLAACDAVLADLVSADVCASVLTLRDAHARRADALRERIAALGGDPLRRPGAGALVFAWLDRLALIGGERGVLALLSRHDARLLEREREAHLRLDPASREFLAQRLAEVSAQAPAVQEG